MIFQKMEIGKDGSGKNMLGICMDIKKISKVKSLLYDCTNDEVQGIISQIEDPEVLYIYAYNYNWDNGFEIPQVILDSDKCNLSIALLIFYRADGAGYLTDKSSNEDLPQWSSFIKKLYDSILDGKYQSQGIEFKVPLKSVYKELHADHETGAADNKQRLSTKHRESARYSAYFVVWVFQRGLPLGTRL